MWGEMIARVWDPTIGDFRPVPHTIPEPSGIFGADRIRKGHAQFGQVDIACFQREPGEEVLVRLEIKYTIVEDGAPVEGEESVMLELGC
jgi:hypothetical protein